MRHTSFTDVFGVVHVVILTLSPIVGSVGRPPHPLFRNTPFREHMSRVLGELETGHERIPKQCK